MSAKVVSLRIPEQMSAELGAVARAEGASISETIRVAIDGHIAGRRTDAEFQARLKKRLEKDREVLERLAE